MSIDFVSWLKYYSVISNRKNHKTKQIELNLSFSSLKLNLILHFEVKVMHLHYMKIHHRVSFQPPFIYHNIGCPHLSPCVSPTCFTCTTWSRLAFMCNAFFYVSTKTFCKCYSQLTSTAICVDKAERTQNNDLSVLRPRNKRSTLVRTSTARIVRLFGRWSLCRSLVTSWI